MQQKIVIKVPMKKEKDRSKAMKIAVGFIGVSSVTIGGEDKDFVVVIGDDVDAVTLTRLLIKKFGGATLVRVELLMRGRQFDQEYDEDDQASSIVQGQQSFHNINNNNNNQGAIFQSPANYYYNHPNYNPPPPYDPYPYYYSYQTPVYDPSCSIM